MAESQIEAWVNRDRDYVYRRTWVDLAHISPNLPLAVVASEDQKFPEHWGFDVEAIEKAYEMNQHSHRVHGASTISQQVAKNLYLWSGRSYFRKALEAYFTVLIESCWPKRRILEIYLNIAEFGIRHVRCRGSRPALFPSSPPRACRGAMPRPRRRPAESRALVRRRPVAICSATARLDPESDAGPGRPGDARRN